MDGKRERRKFMNDLKRGPRVVWYMLLGAVVSAPLALIRPEFVFIGASGVVMLGLVWEVYRAR